MKVLRHIDGPAAFAEAFSVSRETLDRLSAYVDVLRVWQRTINLVSPATVDDIWHRHLADSAQLVAIALDALAAGSAEGGNRSRSWIDLGSGAGFPGLVAALLLDGRAGAGPWRISLVESDQRKCAFLREVVRITGVGRRVTVSSATARGAGTPTDSASLDAVPGQVMSVDILGTRIEKIATHVTVEPIDVVSARALAPLDRLLGLARPLLENRSNVALFMKGRDAAAEVEVAQRRWVFRECLVPSVTDPAAAVVVIRGLQPREEGRSQ